MEIEYEIRMEPELMQIEGNASAIDEETDRETVDWIRGQLARGNDWAWCSVQVIATIPDMGVRGESSWLGGCSYKSERDFKSGDFEITDPDGTKRSSGYYQDMCNEAREDLLNNLREAHRNGIASVEALVMLGEPLIKS